MQQRKASGGQITGRKIGSRQQNTQPHSQPQSSKYHQKQKEDNLVDLIKQYLDKNGFPRTFQSLKNQRPVKKAAYNYGGSRPNPNSSQEQERAILLHFDKGHREEFFKQTSKLFAITNSTNSSNSTNVSEQYLHNLRKLQFELNIYFCIYSIHPCTGNSRKAIMEKSAVQAFKKFIDTKGSQMSEESELLSFFALPYLPKPQQNPGMAKVFTKEWINKLRTCLLETYKDNIASKKPNSQACQNKENTKHTFNSVLEQIYQKHMNQSTNQKKQKQEEEECFNPSHLKQIQELRNHNKEMVSYLDIMQQNLKQLNEASKVNLIESNRKWFQFSKQILQLAKKSLKSQNNKTYIQKLEKYEQFFGSNIDELIYSSADISLFEKNSYTDETVNNYQGAKNFTNQNNDGNPQYSFCQIDTNKIMNLFSKANKVQLQKEICLVLKALKDRLYTHKNAHSRRQVIVSYQRNDICAIKESNYNYQKKLLLQSGENIKLFYLRLMNHISTDNLGNQYLSSSQKLIENLIGIMGETTEDVCYRKHVFGLLQRFSYIKKSQLTMISFGIIPMIFKVFRSEGETLQYSSIQYLMGLIMNLAINKNSIKNFEKHKSEIIQILLKYIEMDDAQIQGFINGTLYVLLQLRSIKDQAVQKYKMTQIIERLLVKTELKLKELEGGEQILKDDEQDQFMNEISDCTIVIRQYNYILERLHDRDTSDFQGSECENRGDNQDEDEEEDFDDLEEIDMNSENQSNSSDYIEGEQNTIAGEQLLMKKYALLGPQAVREQLLTRSILDETGRKSHNMTTSINHSKRMDRLFCKNQRVDTPSLLPNNLDLSLTPNK